MNPTERGHVGTVPGAPGDQGATKTSTGEILSGLLRGNKAHIIPGVYDALSARCADALGFPVLHATGAGISCSLGYPDLGLVTMTEMIGRVRDICRAVSAPVIADADTGYGNAVNMFRTVREFEAAGAAGIHIEDQISPKKCGNLSGKQVTPRDEAVKKLEAALAARRDPQFLIIARTDARETYGVKEVVARCKAFVASGADCVFPMALESEDELVEVGEAVPGPKMITATHGGKTPNLGPERFAELGYVLVVHAMSPILAATHALQAMMAALKKDESDSALGDRMVSFGEIYGLLGLSAYQQWDSQFPVRD